MISLSAKGLAHGEICAHLAAVYGAAVSKQTISTITDRVLETMAEWQSRPLDSAYPVLFMDCINVKIKEADLAGDGGDLRGNPRHPGLWVGEHAEPIGTVSGAQPYPSTPRDATMGQHPTHRTRHPFSLRGGNPAIGEHDDIGEFPRL